MHEERTKRLGAFVDWAQQHISGDEKGEAQIYLDRLFQAFGQQGLIEAGGHAEFRIKKASEDGGGTSFADYVWKPVVLFEMKKRGVDLAKHRRQAEEYWWRLVPNRPQYVVLCNFDRFDIYDFNTQIDSPKDSVTLADLPQRWGPLAFLFPTQEKPSFDNDHIAVTRDAADLLARCYTKLEIRKVDEDLRRRFILQMLVALFAEDIGLLPKYLVAGLLDECKSPAASYDLLGDLFAAMNNARGNPGGRFKGVRYFNGGLFADPARIELHDDEINQLKQAAKSDWSKVSPEIFGTLFEHSLGKEERHAYGAHFTSPVDIMKIVKPTIVEPWTAAIESAKTLKQLRGLQDRLHRYTVLDPACGSGNFLYLAYRELKRVEFRLLERIGEFSSTDPHQLRLESVTARQFFGLDINRFAIELAKVTMMIARKLAIDELHVVENALPLDNLDQNFLAVDALLSDASSSSLSPSPGTPGEGRGEGLPSYIQTPWPRADVIIGNPPFLGAKRLKPERGPDYVNAVRKLYPDVPGMADYCVYWFRRAHDHLPDCTNEDPLAGRAGLVGTQNIRNNQSRVGGLDHIAATGTIIEAVDNQPWSGEANVHVSIANWVKTQDAELLPETRRLWTKAPVNKGLIIPRSHGTRRDKECELISRDVDEINAALSDKADTTEVKALVCTTKPQRVFNGHYPRHQGFRVESGEAARMIEADSRNGDVVHPFLIGAVMLTNGGPDQWVIDFQRRTIFEAQQYSLPFAKVQREVLPHIEALAAKEREKTGKATGQDQNWLQTWWQHFRSRPDMHAAIGNRLRYIACCEVTKRPIFCFVHRDIRADKTMEVFAFDDDYSFGILQSSAHWLWFITKCSKLKSDFRYTPESVFDTFPWPQSPTVKQIDAVAAAAVELRRIRTEALAHLKGGLRALYRTLELPGANPLKDAHATLDAAVLAAYGFSARKDLLAQLLDLNLSVSAAEKAGQPVTAPGIPPAYPDPAKLITEDCIRP